MRMCSSPAAEMEGVSRRLFLIRHAESINNVDKGIAKRSFPNVLKGVFPSLYDLRRIGGLVTFPMDSDLSPRGEAMVAALARKLDATRFIQSQGVDLIAHSHLVRAKRTCQGLFPPDSSGVPMQEHALLYEKDLLEHAQIRNLESRVASFKSWLLALPEHTKCITVVSHSAFFRCLLQTDVGMRNCEVVSCVMQPDGTVADAQTFLEGGEDLLKPPGAAAPVGEEERR